MKPRAKRDLTALAGVVVVLVILVLTNSAFQRADLREQATRQRNSVEQKRAKQGVDLLKWPLVRETVGTLSSGPTFHEKLKAKGGQHVDIVGFMVPLEQFRNMTEFLLLPVPIECYFCRMPPARDVILVQMAKGESVGLYEEPVLINGTLKLNEGEDVKFFYELNNAKLGAGERQRNLTPNSVAPEHMVPKHDEQQEQLLEGTEPPNAT